MSPALTLSSWVRISSSTCRFSRAISGSANAGWSAQSASISRPCSTWRVSTSARSPKLLRPEKPPIDPASASISCAMRSPLRVAVPRVTSDDSRLLMPLSASVSRRSPPFHAARIATSGTLGSRSTSTRAPDGSTSRITSRGGGVALLFALLFAGPAGTATCVLAADRAARSTAACKRFSRLRLAAERASSGAARGSITDRVAFSGRRCRAAVSRSDAALTRRTAPRYSSSPPSEPATVSKKPSLRAIPCTVSF